MKTVLLAIMLVGLTANAWAFGDNSYSQGEGEFDKPLRKVNSWDVVKPEPVVEVDRHVLSKADYLNDPSVLISLPREVKREEPAVVALPVAKHNQSLVREAELPAVETKDVIITTQWCDDNGCDEPKVQ